MDLSPKGMLLKWCMWVYIWCIAVSAWSKRGEYRNKETSQNIWFFFFFLWNAETYTLTKKKGIPHSLHSDKPCAYSFNPRTWNIEIYGDKFCLSLLFPRVSERVRISEQIRNRENRTDEINDSPEVHGSWGSAVKRNRKQGEKN